MEQFSDQLLISDFSPCSRPRGYLRETGDFSYNTRACALAPPTSPDHGFFLQYPCMRSCSPNFTRLWVLLYPRIRSRSLFPRLHEAGNFAQSTTCGFLPDTITSEVFGQLA